ncbi:MAG TPA: prolyl oligopeptidase family serine peptidase [Planctomycetota bacterium]|nr:prolyl oligopeptidase family serine peptidase [Planctomycetota bacterium]HRR79319.1 prolyl oligopeptidase family serine peptidase [Planctomycetota bacterium]HRT97356.1 prolyl oligopeptidase family serine peptidase [Planctomycetota bacterium]
MPRSAAIATLLLLGAAMSDAAETPKPADKPGDKVLEAYIRQEALRLDAAFADDLASAKAWRQRRDEYRRQLLWMLGLWPLPERTPLNPVVTGIVEGEGYVVEKLHFQSRPGLYVTANLYRPKKPEGRLPAVLYGCGHANKGRDGNKTAYQPHGIWLATHGYVCLMIDSLMLGEIASIHHGTYRENRWWWHSRGYTPAGVECWNCIRALDYLETRPEVDPTRLGVTGRSGGGAYTAWVTAADDRVKAAIPVSGISDLEDYLNPPVINGHCDCMFLYNTYQWPWTRILGLAAPRPLLFTNSDADTIFPMPGNERTIERLRKLYALLGQPGHVDAFVTPGPHKDGPPLRIAAFGWFNRFLKGDAASVTEPETYPTIEGKELRAFPDDLPADAINPTIDRQFVPVATVAVPTSPQALAALRGRLLAELHDTSFRAWPKELPANPIQLGDAPSAGALVSEPPLETAYRYLPAKQGSRVCWLLILNEGDKDDALPEWAADVVGNDACVVLAPRGVGPTETTLKQPYYFRRSMALLGRTLDSGRLWDILAFLRCAERPGTTWKIAGKGQAGILGAYAALFDERLAEAVCLEPPATHDDGPYFLSVMRVLDIPDALGLLAPRPLVLRGAAAEAFDKTTAYYRAAGAAQMLTRR